MNNETFDRFFTFSSMGEFKTHATEEKARAEAESDLDQCRDCSADGGWDETVTNICWGEIRQGVVQTVCRPRREDEPHEFDEIWDFALEPGDRIAALEADAFTAWAEVGKFGAAFLRACAEIAELINRDNDDKRDELNLKRLTSVDVVNRILPAEPDVPSPNAVREDCGEDGS